MASSEDRPSVQESEAKDILVQYYNKKVTSITQLKSFEARNFKVTCQSQSQSPTEGSPGEVQDQGPIKSGSQEGDRFVLKIVKAKEMDPKLLELQFECMIHMRDYGLNSSQPQVNISGKFYAEYTCRNGQKCFVNLLSFIPGKVAQDYITSRRVMFDVGLMVVEVQNCLKEFKPKTDVKLETKWSLNQVSKLKEFLDDLDTVHQRNLVVKAIEVFENGKEQFGNLGKGWIHGDIHDGNIIVMNLDDDNDDNDDGSVKQRYGIIDFEDMHVNYCILDLIIAMVGVMISVPFSDGNEEAFLRTSGDILAGYLSKRVMTSDEKAIMYPAMIGRYAQELVFSTRDFKHQNATNEYLTGISSNAWPQLEYMLRVGESRVHEIWNETLKSWGRDAVL